MDGGDAMRCGGGGWAPMATALGAQFFPRGEGRESSFYRGNGRPPRFVGGVDGACGTMAGGGGDGIGDGGPLGLLNLNGAGGAGRVVLTRGPIGKEVGPQASQMQDAGALFGDCRRVGCWSTGSDGSGGFTGDGRAPLGMAAPHTPVLSPTGVAWVPGSLAAPPGAPASGSSMPSLSAAPGPVIKKRRNTRVRVAELLPSEVHQCPSAGCGKRFAKKYNLKIHLRRHAGALPFVCTGDAGSASGCGKRFMWQSSFTRHKRSHEKRAAERAAEAAAHAGGLAAAAVAAALPATAGGVVLLGGHSRGGTGGVPQMGAVDASVSEAASHLGCSGIDEAADDETDDGDGRPLDHSERRSAVRRLYEPPVPSPMPSQLLQAVARMAERFSEENRRSSVERQSAATGARAAPLVGNVPREALSGLPPTDRVMDRNLSGQPWAFPPSLSLARSPRAAVGDRGRVDGVWPPVADDGTAGVMEAAMRPQSAAGGDGGGLGGFAPQPAPCTARDGACSAPLALWGSGLPKAEPVARNMDGRGAGGAHDASSAGMASGNSHSFATLSPTHGPAKGEDLLIDNASGGRARLAASTGALDGAVALPSPLARSIQSPLMASGLSPLLPTSASPFDEADGAASTSRPSPITRSLLLDEADKGHNYGDVQCSITTGTDRGASERQRAVVAGDISSPLLSSFFPNLSVVVSPFHSASSAATDSLLVPPWGTEGLFSTSPLSCTAVDWPAASAPACATSMRQDQGAASSSQAAHPSGLLFPGAGDGPLDRFM